MGIPGRLGRRRRRVVPPAPPEVERYYGPATLELSTKRGSWSPKVDLVGLGCRGTRCTVEAVLDDGDVRPTLPWWLRTTSPAELSLHLVRKSTEAPEVRRRTGQTVIRWTTSSEHLIDVLERARALPPWFAPMLERPPSREERYVIRDFALATGDPLLARWLGGDLKWGRTGYAGG